MNHNLPDHSGLGSISVILPDVVRFLDGEMERYVLSPLVCGHPFSLLLDARQNLELTK